MAQGRASRLGHQEHAIRQQVAGRGELARKSLVGVVADELLDRIIAGEFPPGASVPGELELSSRHEVSRMTVREAMKTLEAQRILSVERGRGTFVNPVNRWGSLDAVLRAASEGTERRLGRHPTHRAPPDAGDGRLRTGCRADAGSGHPGPPRARGKDAAGARQATIWRHSSRQTSPSTTSSCRPRKTSSSPSLFEPLHRVLEKRRTETSKVPRHPGARHRAPPEHRGCPGLTRPAPRPRRHGCPHAADP